MKQTQSIMGMHITIEVADSAVLQADIDTIFAYFRYIDETFSTYKKSSEVSQINDRKLSKERYSKDMKTILSLAEQTKQESKGYFDIFHNGKIDPSGIVKGWAIFQAAELLKKKGFLNFYVDAGGDIQVSGKNIEGNPWSVGIRNPFKSQEIVKVLSIRDKGIATSGTSIRGQHIYNPHKKNVDVTDIVSLTVIGPNVYEADRFATAAFAMGYEGIAFIDTQLELEGYMIDKQGIATYTNGFTTYLQ